MMIKKFLNDDNKDLLWNYISVAILAVCGFLMNILIVFFYDENILGVFNQSYAWYVIFSQLASLGVHSAVLKYTSEYANGDYRKCLSSALLAGVGLAVIFTALAELVLYKVSFLADAKICLCYCLLGIPLFVGNKIILGYLNGLSRLRAYAFFQSMRYILLVLIIFTLGMINAPGNYLGVVFLFEELILFISMIIKYGREMEGPSWHLLKEQILFGIKVLPSNLTAEITPKADIVCLSIMGVNNGMIGIYSLVCSFSEGYYNLYLVLRRKVDPIIAMKFSEERTINISNISGKIKNYVIYLLPVCGLIIVAIYYVFFALIGKTIYLNAYAELIILYLSIMMNGYGIAFSNMLAQIGFPEKESMINIITLAFNVCLNVIMIKYWGIMGAAVATALSYFVFSSLLYFEYKRLQKSMNN